MSNAATEAECLPPWSSGSSEVLHRRSKRLEGFPFGNYQLPKENRVVDARIDLRTYSSAPTGERQLWFYVTTGEGERLRMPVIGKAYGKYDVGGLHNADTKLIEVGDWVRIRIAVDRFTVFAPQGAHPWLRRFGPRMARADLLVGPAEGPRVTLAEAVIDLLPRIGEAAIASSFGTAAQDNVLEVETPFEQHLSRFAAELSLSLREVWYHSSKLRFVAPRQQSSSPSVSVVAVNEALARVPRDSPLGDTDVPGDSADSNAPEFRVLQTGTSMQQRVVLGAGIAVLLVAGLLLASGAW